MNIFTNIFNKNNKQNIIDTRTTRIGYVEALDKAKQLSKTSKNIVVGVFEVISKDTYVSLGFQVRPISNINNTAVIAAAQNGKQIK